MKKIIFLLIIAQSNILFSQSKKEQIQILSLRIDSLERVLENERRDNVLKIKELDLAITNFESQTNALKSEITDYANKLGQLKADLNLLVAENGRLKVQLSNKSDSLILVSNQLNQNVPENDFDLLVMNFRTKENDVRAQIKWIEEKVKVWYRDSKEDTTFFTKQCLEYVSAVQDNYWAAGDDEEEAHRRWNQDTIKWKTYYDLKYSPTAYVLGPDTESGPPLMIKVEFLGELKNGKWFKLTIKGGGGTTGVRVLKLIRSGGRYYIDNIMKMTEQ
jgi:hypothetical protein